MKKILQRIMIIVIAVVCFENNVLGQSHCSTIINTTTTYNTTDPNFWDWKATVWQTNIYSTRSAQRGRDCQRRHEPKRNERDLIKKSRGAYFVYD